MPQMAKEENSIVNKMTNNFSIINYLSFFWYNILRIGDKHGWYSKYGCLYKYST